MMHVLPLILALLYNFYVYIICSHSAHGQKKGESNVCVCGGGGKGGGLYSPPEIKRLHKFPSVSSDVDRMFRCFIKRSLIF